MTDAGSSTNQQRSDPQSAEGAEEVPPATQPETVAAILERSSRSWVPMRNSALRQKKGSIWEPGPLPKLVTRKDQRALDLYLLAHALASKAPFDATLPSAVWARALGFGGSLRSQGTAISRVASRLADAKLITRERKSRKSSFILLDESGDGSAYSHPGKRGHFFRLPYSYWLEGWDQQLTLPGKFILLVALTRKPDFILPLSKAFDWYGISSDTAERGIDQLLDHRLLSFRRARKKAPLAPRGFSYDRHFSLLPPFDPDTIANLKKKKR